MATEGISTAGPEMSPQEAAKAIRNANLAKGRATAAENRAKLAAAARGADADAEPSKADLGRSAARQAQAQRTPGTVIGRTAHGRVIVVGRDGKPISRQGETSIDKYAIPKNEIPAGWAYQWIAETVLNEPQTAAMMDFQQKQWTPVPQDRHPTHPVRQGGLMLVERPQVFSDEARQEEMKEARDQIKANVEQFEPPGDLRKTGRVRKGRPVSVAVDGVPEPTVEIAD